MNYAEAEKMLKKCGQEHVLAYWKKLGKKEQAALLEQIATIEPKNLAYCQQALKTGADVPDSSKGKAPKVAVLKGKKLPGRMGGERVTVQHLTVVRVDADRNLILIKGAIPGPKGGIVLIRDSVKNV